jgi:hypothetical protein
MTKTPDGYIAPEVFDQLERLNLKNIAEKLKAGKVLTAHEERTLKSAQESSKSHGHDERMTSEELRHVYLANVGKTITRQGIEDFCTNHNVRRAEDKTYSKLEYLKAWRESKAEGNDPSNPKTAKILKECKILDLRIGQIEGELYPKDEVVKASVQLVADFRSSLKSWLDHTSAKFPDHAAIWQEAHDSAIKAVQDGLSI